MQWMQRVRYGCFADEEFLHTRLWFQVMVQCRVAVVSAAQIDDIDAGQAQLLPDANTSALTVVERSQKTDRSGVIAGHSELHPTMLCVIRPMWSGAPVRLYSFDSDAHFRLVSNLRRQVQR